MTLSTRSLAIVVALVMSVGGCSAAPPPSDKLNVDNGSTLEVVIVVNGTQIGSAAPHRVTSFARSDLGSPPWTIEARTRSGRQLLLLPVAPEVVAGSQGTETGIDLSCERLVLYFGTKAGRGEPGPGTPGDCDQ
jgi:hypothetical protein